MLFCKAVPGVGGTVCGVFKDHVSKCKGWWCGGDENKIQFHMVSFCSAIKFTVIAGRKIGEKCSKCNTFQVISDLLH